MSIEKQKVHFETLLLRRKKNAPLKEVLTVMLQNNNNDPNKVVNSLKIDYELDEQKFLSIMEEILDSSSSKGKVNKNAKSNDVHDVVVNVTEDEIEQEEILDSKVNPGPTDHYINVEMPLEDSNFETMMKKSVPSSKKKK